MKPLKVVMSAFGPYKDRVEIDFTKFGDNGIFLITGDTGSGKTTIFDAISFALFGEASGSRRENSSFRSDFALADVPTFVRLEFIHKDILYVIERIPRYMRKKKRGEGMTSVGGEATLSYLDQVITGEKNVTDKCVEILGMNASQFKQIVMIAQGEFLELLLAKPKDRAEIFRHIFDTGIFKLISEKLKQYYLDKKREYEDNVLEIKNYVQGIQLERELLGDESTEQVLEYLEEELSNDTTKEKQLEEEKQIVFDEYQKIIKAISEGQIINDSIVSLKKYQNQLDCLLENEASILEKKSLFFKNKDIWEIIIPVLTEKERLTTEIHLKKDQFDKKEKEFFEVKKQYQKCSKEYQLLDEKQKTIQVFQRTVEELNRKFGLIQEIERLNEELEESVQLFHYCQLLEKKEQLLKFQVFKDKMNEIDNLKSNLVKEKEDYILKNQNYLANYDLFLSAQAGILASQLEEGESCPVCGSTVHPCKAKLIEKVCSKEELDKEKEIVEQSYQRLENLRLDIIQKENAAKVLQKELDNILEEDLYQEVLLLEKKCEALDEFDLEVNGEELEVRIQNLKFAIEEKNQLLEVTDSKADLLKKIGIKEKEIVTLENDIKREKSTYEEVLQRKAQLESLIEVLKLDIVELQKKLEETVQKYVYSYQSLGYETEEDYLNVKLSRDEMTVLDKEVREYSDKVLELRGKIETLKKVINGNSEVNIDNLQEQLNIINEKLSNFDSSLKILNNKISNNKKIYDKLKIVSEKTTKIEKEVMVYKDLSDTANGTISGKAKLEFEQFVQARYFDQVIELANKRFGYMTDDRYQLVRKEEAVKLSDKLGLELEVMDYYTGKRRDVRTLSGGESFKAALSLALGMSDTIQQFAGGVVIEAMFIDEGFGSLDDESLDQAMNAIMMLSQGNKIIGIISHVNELKARIDKKIVVKKSNCGSEVSLVL